MATRPDGSKATALLGARRLGRTRSVGFGRAALGSRLSVDAWLLPPAGPDWGAATPAEFDHAETGIVLTGTGFEASQGTGLVELGDSIDYTTATKATQTVTAWAAGSITITANLGALGPGIRWMFTTNNSGQRSEGRPVIVHRAAAFTSSLSPNITAAGVDATTARLTAPTGRTTADFDAGRRVDDSATAPSTTTTTTDYTEGEWAVEALPAAVVGETYEFRLVKADGSLLADYTHTPEWTVTAGGGPTNYPVALAGATTTTGALAKQPRRTIPLGGATLPPAGALTRSTSKPLAATLTLAATLSVTRAILRAFAGAVTSAGTATRTTAKPLAAATTPAGAVTRQPRKTLTGALAPAATLATIKAVLRAFAGSVGPTATLTRSTGRPTAGTVSASATLARSTGKALTGTITSLSTLARAKVALLALTGTVATTATLARRANKTFTGSAASTSTVTRRVAKPLAAAISAAGAVSRSTARTLTGAIATAATLATQTGTRTIQLLGSLTSSATVSRSTSKATVGAVAGAGQLARQVRRTVAGTLTSSATLARTRVVLLALAGSLAQTGTLARRTSKALAAVLAPAGTLTRPPGPGTRRGGRVHRVDVGPTGPRVRRSAQRATPDPDPHQGAAGEQHRRLRQHRARLRRHSDPDHLRWVAPTRHSGRVPPRRPWPQRAAVATHGQPGRARHRRPYRVAHRPPGRASRLRDRGATGAGLPATGRRSRRVPPHRGHAQTDRGVTPWATVPGSSATSTSGPATGP